MNYKDKLFLETRANLFASSSRTSGGIATTAAKKVLQERLESSDKKEVEKMIKRAVAAETSRSEERFKKHMKKYVKTREFKNLVDDMVNSEVSKLPVSSKQDVVDITKKVLVKLYRELAYNYTPVIDRIKL